MKIIRQRWRCSILEPFSLVLRQSHIISNLSMPKCQRMSGIISVIYSPPPIPIGHSGLQLFQLDFSESNWNPQNPTGIQASHWIPLGSSGIHPLPHTTSCIAPLSPHERWLMAVVVGAVTVGCGGPHLRPPHKQWLMRLGAGGVSLLSSVPPSPVIHQYGC
jgi:hypothetical protein